MEQKHINTIRTCLKTMRVLGKVEDRDDIEDALEAFDMAMKQETIKVDTLKCPLKSCVFNDGEHNCYFEGNPREDKRCTRKW